MTLTIMHIKVSSRKRKELSQAIILLLSSISSEKGFVGSDFFQGMEDENVFCLLQEWKTWNDFEKHCKSENYKVLQGAMLLLDEPCEIILYERFQPAGSYKVTG